MSEPPAKPRWRRRAEARPGEIVAAAQAEFAEKGFAAARLEDIAARAGVSKGALYLYFANKTELFRAVVRDAIAPDIDALVEVLDTFPGPLWQLVTTLFERLPQVAGSGGAAPVAKMVVGESRNFPDLARVWHDAVVSKALGALTRIIATAQDRGEVRPGDPRHYAVQLIAPLVVGMLWGQVFEPVGAEPIALEPLARQHARTVLRGMLMPEALAHFEQRIEP
jgi:AcrR family transcriptional regulator